MFTSIDLTATTRRQHLHNAIRLFRDIDREMTWEQISHTSVYTVTSADLKTPHSAHVVGASVRDDGAPSASNLSRNRIADRLPRLFHSQEEVT